MTLFFITIAILLIIALAWALRPLLRRSPQEALQSETANLAILRDQFEELEADHRAGLMSSEQYSAAKTELERRVLDEVSPPIHKGVVEGRSKIAAFALIVLLVGGSAALYALMGTPQALNTAAPIDMPITAHQVDDMIAQLARRMEQQPEDTKGWGILARSYYALGRYEESARAYERLMKLESSNADVLADYADALAMAQGGKLSGRPVELLQQAFKLDATQWKARMLLGSEAFDREDYRSALKYWEPLLNIVPPDAEFAQQLRAGVEEARSRSGQASPAGTHGVSGIVQLAPDLAARVRADDTVFVFARATQGPKMPLAVLRLKAGQLPAKFILSDAQAMRPDLRLSQFDRVIIGARVSRSGNPSPQSGDLEGHTAPVAPGAQGLRLMIDRQIP